jgi:hypothetical protein
MLQADREVAYLFGVLALAESAVEGLAQMKSVVQQSADLTLADFAGLGIELRTAQGLQSMEHRVNLDLRRDEGAQGFGLVLLAASLHGLRPMQSCSVGTTFAPVRTTINDN